MVEQAFRVAKDSPLYKEYFEAHAEKQKFHDLAKLFFEAHDLMQNMGYYQTAYLALQLTDEQREKYSTQLKKLIDNNNMSYFKKNCPMSREWWETVVSKVDLDTMDKLWCWYWPYINKGQYSLWNYKDQLYGYLKDDHKDKLELSDYMEPIKMSEYYAIMEERHDAQQ